MGAAQDSRERLNWLADASLGPVDAGYGPVPRGDQEAAWQPEQSS